MTNRRSAIVLGVLLGLSGLWLFFDPGHRPNFSDFNVYWVAGSKAALSHTVYDVAGHYQYKYSPFVALLWSLPTHFRSAYLWSRLHFIATGIGWYALLYALARVVDPKRALPLWAALVAIFTTAIRDELKLGQVNLWPFLLVLPAWFYPRLDRSRDRGFDLDGLWIGAAWGFAIQWKLYALIFGPLWLLRRRPAVFLGLVAITLLTLGGAMALAHGPAFALAENVRWVQSLSASSRELIVSQYNVSLLGILGKWGSLAGIGFGAWAYLIWLVLLGLGLWAMLWAEQDAPRSSAPLPWFWSASFAWAFVAVINPLVWPYWQLLAAPLFLVYFARATATGWRVDARFWSVVATFTLMNWLQNTTIVHYGGGLVALLLLLADAFVRARRGTQATGVSPIPASEVNA